MSARRATSREAQREATRERLFESALDVFRRDGVEAARIEDISSMAGVSRGTFYFHFPTKDDVLLELLRRTEEDLVTELDGLDESSSFEDVLMTVAKHMNTHWAEEPALLTGIGVVSMRAAAGGRFDEARDAHPARGALIPHVRRAMDRGEIVNLLPADLTVDFFLMNLFGMALAWVGSEGADLDTLLGAFVQFFLRAVRV
ncbi:MAG: TetR/AcrR family transcriptional regulator [Deltaproteobacteria bacterium]|nr:MAG: TetR/AcrR family transcriptional regulator [Deltaproteobacteria bacterium]